MYSVRIDVDELAELKALAKAEGVSLSDAMRVGARAYLTTGGDPAKAKVALQTAVDDAVKVLRSL